jgi:hypothetical protein
VIDFPRAQRAAPVDPLDYRPDPERSERRRGDLAFYLDFDNWRLTRLGRLCPRLQGAIFVLFQLRDGWRWWITWDDGEARSSQGYPYQEEARDRAWRKWCAVRSLKEA